VRFVSPIGDGGNPSPCRRRIGPRDVGAVAAPVKANLTGDDSDDMSEWSRAGRLGHTLSNSDASRILDLYARRWEGRPLAADEYVLSTDEKTSIQARIRRHPSTPPSRCGWNMRTPGTAGRPPFGGSRPRSRG